ncbi:uncharacterized protein LOC133681569 [Populus nigra]|uniref:uncharacterized protein LOC133681569 n=1 Tax=Populus nigra TaxID=3691 RepID=UPI002B27773D|nr:uncharacterized protein LOC133681569 [Populus nigra]
MTDNVLIDDLFIMYLRRQGCKLRQQEFLTKVYLCGTACFESNTMFPDVKNTIGTCREHHLWDSFAGTIDVNRASQFTSNLNQVVRSFLLFPLSIPADWNAPRLPSILALNFHGSNYIVQSAWTVIWPTFHFFISFM